MKDRMVTEFMSCRRNCTPASYILGRECPIQKKRALETDFIELRNCDIELRVQ